MFSSVLLAALHFGLILAVALRVLMRRPARGVALAWLLLVVALPYAGAIIYFLIGERRIGRSRHERIRRLRDDYKAITGANPTYMSNAADWTRDRHDHAALDSLGQRFFGVPTLTGSSVDLRADTVEILAAIAEEVAAARMSVLMEFYIWNEGGAADRVLDAVMDAARRGVKCLLLIDAVGASTWWKGGQPQRLREAGVDLRQALPVGVMQSLVGRTDVRLHRKIVVIDGAIGWTGSMNLVDPRYFKQDAGVGEWVDAMVRIEGPAVSLLAAVMLGDWVAEGGERVHDVVQAVGLKGQAPSGETRVQVMPSGPGESRDGLLQVMLTLINAARREIVMTTPYFVPDDAMVLALRGAAARGVKVVLVLPERIDSILVRFASRSFYDEIMELGGDVHFYKAGLLHTKSIGVDGELALFGTANLDMRSLWLNYEVSLLIYDAGFAGRLRSLQQTYLDRSLPLDLAAWNARPFHERLAESAMRLMSPLL
ncbi:MAG: cardiolipin synthase [Hyphomicrobiales bacterium]